MGWGPFGRGSWKRRKKSAKRKPSGASSQRDAEGSPANSSRANGAPNNPEDGSSSATTAVLLPQALPANGSTIYSQTAPTVASDAAEGTLLNDHVAGSPKDQTTTKPRTLEPGLHVIYDSIKDDNYRCIAEVDIVAVHGLNFKGRPNHALETWMKGDKLWLSDFLPTYLPRPARVMLFAYNSSPAIGAASIKLDDHARNLLRCLRDKRKSVPQRPLVFICHSLGGLVVKEALIEAKLDSSHNATFEATCLLVFFATPHRGGNYASIGDVAAKICTTLLGTPTNDLLDALKWKSNEAERRFQQARHLFERCIAISFFEGASYHGAGLIVDRDSATLNLPGSIETQVPIDADHSAICKFDSIDSLTCQLVVKTIAKEVKRGLELKIRKSLPPDHTSFSERDAQCLRDLGATDSRRNKTRIEQDNGHPRRELYAWVLSNADFQRWRDGEESRLLWIRGDPGKGKTMMLCGIIDELKKGAPTANISFFFCQATDNRMNNATSVLRGLIHMFVTQEPTFVSHLRKSHDDSGKQRFEGPNSWVPLSKIFARILEEVARLRQTYLIIDALDECTGDGEKLLQLIAQRSTKYPSIKWLVSSHNCPDIEKDLHAIPQKITLSLEQNQESVSSAVTTYIRLKVGWLAERNDYSNDIQDAIARYLSANAQSIFLWVTLVCQELANISEWEVEELLSTFPPGLDALYRRMIDQIYNTRHAKLLRRILATASVTYRPLTLDELPALVEVPPRASGNDKALTEIVQLCGSFLTVRNRTIHFVHQTAKDFLLKHAREETFPSGIEDIHYAVFSRSLRVMHDVLRRDVYRLGAPGYRIDQVVPPNPDPLAMVRYSCVYWVRHFLDCDPLKNAEVDLENDGSINTFLRVKYLNWLEALSLLRSVPEGIASLLDLEKLFKVRKGTSSLIDRVRDACRFSLYHKWPVENYPLQVYASALIFSPASSITRNQFRSEEPEWMIQEPIMEDNWSAYPQTLEGHDGYVHGVAWSHDTTKLASSSGDGTVKIWDPATGQCVSTFNCRDDDADVALVTSVAWSHDSTRLAAGLDDGTVMIWNVATGGCIEKVYAHTSTIRTVAWYKDATRLATGSRDGTARVHDLRTGRLISTIEGDFNVVSTLVWSHDISRLASSSTDLAVKIWDPATGQCISVLEGHSGWVTSIAWSCDATRLASGSEDQTIRVWDLATGQCLSTLETHRARVTAVAWLDNASMPWLASASDDFTVKVWDRETRRCVSALKAQSGKIASLCWLPNATRLASGSHDGTIKIWDPAARSQFASTHEGHSSGVRIVALSHDAGRIASVSEDGTVKIWDTVTGRCLSTLDLSGNAFVPTIAWSYDSTSLALGLNDGLVKIWSSVTSNQCIISTLTGNPANVSAVAWSHDTKRLASGSANGVITIWDPASGQCISTLTSNRVEVSFVAWSPDSNRLASGSLDGRVMIWNLANGEHISTLTGHKHRVCAVAWSYDTNQLASGSVDGLVKIWDPMAGQCVWTFRLGKRPSLQFHQLNPNLLHTNYGTVALQPVNHPAPVPADSDRQLLGAVLGYGLSLDWAWITYKGEKLLWLPAELRPDCFQVSGTVVAIGCASGRVLSFKMLELAYL